jgi:hypothetical protein
MAFATGTANRLAGMAGWDQDLLAERQRIKRATIANRRLQHRLQAA